jgi:hypothetical protein
MTNSKITVITGFALYPTIVANYFWGPLASSASLIPAPLVLPIFLGPLALLLYLGYLLIGPLMMLWNPDAFEGGQQIPKRSKVLLLVSSLLAFLFGVIELPDVHRYLGTVRTITIYSISFLIFLILLGLFWLNKRQARFSVNLAFHWLLFSWLMTYAFPAVLTDVP